MGGMIEHHPDAVTTDVATQTLREAYDAHATGLLRLCVLLSGRQDVAEELVQETFERTARAGALETLPQARVGAYLRTTALNLWRNRLRRLAIERRGRARTASRDAGLSFEQRDELWSAVRRLPTRQRACVVLRYYQELSEQETATLLGCSVGTVKSQTSRAIARLREEIPDVDR